MTRSHTTAFIIATACLCFGYASIPLRVSTSPLPPFPSPLLSASVSPRNEDGYRAWLRYEALDPIARDSLYANLPRVVFAPDDSLIVRTARQELMNGLGLMLGAPLRLTSEPRDQGAIVLGKISVIAGALESEASE